MTAEEMDLEEMTAFLRDANTGVLSLTNGSETYAVPESFAYDDGTIYFQFANRDGSHKMSFVGTTDVATVTVFAENPARSVIARGPIERVPEHETLEATSALAENASIPTLNVVPDVSVDELSFELYRVDLEFVTGRRFPESRSQTVTELPDICIGHLEDALRDDDPAEKDYHIRQAMQACSPLPDD
ncbi:pyridoxamine 5'-phosphate oxidase family protein [Natronolimnohabitans innermongolicus]|uniref:Pyridoxamine 5'-phosphate oxidase-like FMN-binding protein n=1 Tax=Natronolimnohabitans innermongolicus JCM 12255 TaxID=1227499 RepID=L9X7Z9_9EURY|nr:pyridoxamine 5'-phosphate oxidase family protein [Natronolimnohabitans innermongolicus]ELY57526.1 pyridoxamine 5'-phosphate oxidase-like FMN-binding protein [Natronolimnohabitans innermongolicus JCM 12255]